MIYATHFTLVRLFTHSRPAARQSRINAGLTVFVVAYSVFHCWINSLVIHSIVFDAMLIACGVKGRRLIQSVKDEKRRGELKRWARWGEGGFPPQVSSHELVKGEKQ